MFTGKTPKRGQAGFTLIELLVVVVLLGILSGIAVFAVGNARDNAIAQACKSQQAQLLKAMDLYYIKEEGRWPKNSGIDGLPDSTYSSSYNGITVSYGKDPIKAALVPQYLKQLPPYTGDSNQEFTLSAKLKPKVGTKSAYIQISAEPATISSVCPDMPTSP
jgi:prepilin-type N-terminal cleavage/methylation domain-containing protein